MASSEYHERKGSIISAMFWMFFLSLLLFWMPVLGPGIAGLVGGKKAGSVPAAVAAVFLPAIIFGVVIFLLAATFAGLPLIGLFFGFGAFVLSLVHVGPLLVGAVIGGLLA
jgi:hypothetical protein